MRVELVASDMTAEELASLASELSEKTAVDTVVADVADHEALEKNLLSTIDKHPDIDLLILCAGIEEPQHVEKLDWRLAKRHFDINTVANYVCLSVFVPHFLAAGSGHVTCLISLGAFAGFPYEHAYNGSKAAMRMIIDGYRAELNDRNITFTSVFPSFVKTPMAVNNAFDIKKYVSPEDAADIIVGETCKRTDQVAFPKSTRILSMALDLMPIWARTPLLWNEMDKKF
jgi:short-subunit dehydrogenase